MLDAMRTGTPACRGDAVSKLRREHGDWNAVSMQVDTVWQVERSSYCSPSVSRGLLHIDPRSSRRNEPSIAIDSHTRDADERMKAAMKNTLRSLKLSTSIPCEVLERDSR